MAADFCVWFVRSPRFVRVRKLAVGTCAALFLYSALYGVAFSSLYTREDSRIQAARWIDEHVPANSRIGVERGAFSMRGMIDPEKNPVRIIQTGWLFEFRGFTTCKVELNYLEDQCNLLDYLVIMDINRYQQFTAVPELIPGGAAFYEALVKGELGFDLVRRFKNYPSIGGLEFRDDGSEPTFTGFDHPAVMVFRKKKTEWRGAWTRFQERMATSPYCSDSLLETAASALRAGDLNASLQAISEAKRRFPQEKVVHLLEAETLQRMDRSDGEAMKQYQAGMRDHQTGMGDRHRHRSRVHWVSGMSLFDLGLADLALQVLEEGARQVPSSSQSWLAGQYHLLALNLYDRGEKNWAAELFLLSNRIHPLPKALNLLALIAFDEKEYEKAAEFSEHSLQLDDKQAIVHAWLGQVTANFLNRRSKALFHLRKAIELDPGLEPELTPLIKALEAGDTDS